MLKNKNRWLTVLLIFCFSLFVYGQEVMYDLNMISENELLLLGLPSDVVEAIILYRQRKHFETIDELKNIRGIEPFYDMLTRRLYVVSDRDYKIRPGDILYIYDKPITVAPDGSCAVYDTVMNVAGLTLNQIKERYFRQTGKILDIRLHKLTGWIYVVGEKGVVKPGNYSASTILELISLCEVDNSRFSGEILVYREGKIIRYDFVTLMLSREDPRLFPADRVYFKKRVLWKVVDTAEPVVRVLRDIAIVFGIYVTLTK